MMLRLLNILAIAALVVSASWVYKIKFESTQQVERVARLRGELRKQRDAIATLRAEWTQLDRPDRIERLAQQHLKLGPINVSQYDPLDKLPERPVPIVPPGTADPIGAIIENFADSEVLTGTLKDRVR